MPDYERDIGDGIHAEISAGGITLRDNEDGEAIHLSPVAWLGLQKFLDDFAAADAAGGV